MTLKKIKNPILFQGDLKKKHYFEGWYYKQISNDEKNVISFIPGISLFDDDPHSFVQYIFVSFYKNNKKTTNTGYIKYPLKEFKYSETPFTVNVGGNVFSESEILIDLANDKVNIQGNIKLGSFTTIKKSILMPNIMGFFAYIPKMECYHGIISMNHRIDGMLKINNKEINFTSGKGYLEKDWGTSFPKEYIWMQCNTFKDKNTSVFVSVANIPFMKKNFRGYICNLVLDGKEYRFATYNSSKMRIKNIDKDNVTLVLENSQVKLSIEAVLNQSGELIAPHKGNMVKKIKEELSGKVKICLYNNENKIIYEDIGVVAGIEVVGF
ncbi:tocopherol cyclase family protein [Clostridium akagii]|uniref:tocopherol cyclase family protein n=1 Tax=Clostridium akagii TaxID=91623 RepID=UPI00055B10A8|nr:tocopherol cyclase family protein [Clostridium akagii]